MAVHHFLAHQIWPQGPPPPLPRGSPSVEPFCFRGPRSAGLGGSGSRATTRMACSARVQIMRPLVVATPNMRTDPGGQHQTPAWHFPALLLSSSPEFPYKGRMAACPGLREEVMTCPDLWRYEATSNIGPEERKCRVAEARSRAARPLPGKRPRLRYRRHACRTGSQAGLLNRRGFGGDL
jgi:hypothetical protein